MPAAVKSSSGNQGRPDKEVEPKNGANGDPKVSELVFRINDITKFKVGESIRSPSKLIELFNYQLEVYPMGQVDNSLSAYVWAIPTSGVSARVAYENVVMQISLVNHRNEEQSMTRRSGGRSYDMDSPSWGWRKLLDKVLREAENPDFFDDRGGIVIKARVDLTNARFTLTPPPIVPPGPSEQEVRIEDVIDYEIGEDMKFKPVWKGNYRTQVAVYPGGHPDHADGQEALAVYIHILESKAQPPSRFLKLKVTVVNQKEFTDSINWVGSFQTDDAGDDSPTGY
ncbi:hypothetical protein FOZ60_007065 [Perkinsus olseni]|uniref:MATH domain-containing protein n=1 Tax=Perkinsus olseni TaxID=32597 RepID=A0A7J6NMC5_PEROL|nr:hypothetical protein FOZ60_007065 [Perkinsus olseni]